MASRQLPIKVGPDDATLLLGSWNKGQCPHGLLFQAVPGCCKCFQQCRIAGTARLGTLLSYQILLEALATPYDCVEQCSMGILAVLCPKEKSCIVWTDLYITSLKWLSDYAIFFMSNFLVATCARNIAHKVASTSNDPNPSRLDFYCMDFYCAQVSNSLAQLLSFLKD